MSGLLGDNITALRRKTAIFWIPRCQWIALAAISALVLIQLYVLLRTAPDAGHAMTVHKYNQSAQKGSGGLLNALYKQRPVRESARKKCSDIEVPSSYWTATSADTQAFVAIPDAGRMGVGDTVCVRVVVPAQKKGVHMAYTPFPNTPWDSVLLDMVGQRTGVSVPVRLQPVMDIRNTFREESHVYEADVRLRDVDEYRAEGYIEFRDARWNCEDALEPADYVPEPLHIPHTLRVEVADPRNASPYRLERHMELPPCTEPDVEGRWIAADALPFDAGQIPPPDNHGRVWLPYTCRLRRITYGEFSRCVQARYPLMHWFGDSNLRRVLKKLATRGEWCATSAEQQTRPCICEDYKEDFARFNATHRELVIDFDGRGGRMRTDENADFVHLPGGETTRIYFHKWEGLSKKNKPAWHASFKDSVSSRFGLPAVAMVSLTNWDAAFDTRAQYSVELERLLGIVAREYPASTELVIRTGQYFCCRSDFDPPDTRSFSRLRNAYFDQYTVAAFQERFGHSHKIHVWDVASLAEHRPWAYRNESTDCNANHARSELVEIENQD
ncbi:hypothetical protein GGF43_001798 [Coemansia sp. RSA 2618]|nr:hypothetical protein GGF43_001798 [Coemansia sp. RSA 2618]